MKEEISNIKKSLGVLSTTYKAMIKSSKNQVLFMAILMKIDSDLDKIEKRSKAGIRIITIPELCKYCDSPYITTTKCSNQRCSSR